MVTHASSNVPVINIFCVVKFMKSTVKTLQASQPSTACENEMTVEQYVVLHESYVKCGSAGAGEN